MPAPSTGRQASRGVAFLVSQIPPERQRPAVLVVRREVHTFDVLTNEVRGSVLEPKDFATWGMTTPDKDPRMGDLVLAAKEGYSFAEPATGDAVMTEGPLKGTHGYLPDDPKLYATFIAWGAGIRRGARLPVTDSVNVAPTIAKLLGLNFDHVDGKPLDILK